jgi:hypothetical protein
VSDIPDAYKIIIDGGLGVEGPEVYALPLNNSYTISLEGQAGIQQDTDPPSVTQFGPGYAVSVEDINLAPGNQGQVNIAADGTQLVYTSENADTPDFILALEGDNESLQAQISEFALDDGSVVTAAIDTDQGNLVLNNAQNNDGTYDLEINSANATGVYTFTHPAIPVSAGDTHYLDYGAWDGSDTMTLNIDEGSDGSIDQTVILRQADEQVYIPLVVR